MGQRLADDWIVIGEPCTGCEGVLWGVGHTPKYVWAHFTNLKPCPGWEWDVSSTGVNKRVFRLTQHELNACRWRAQTIDGFTANWYLHRGVPPRSYMYLDHVPFHSFFQSITPPNDWCRGSFFNQNVCNGLFAAHQGFCWIEWKQIAIDQARELGLTLNEHLFYEVFQIDLVTVVYKFTDKPRNVNIKVKLSWA